MLWVHRTDPSKNLAHLKQYRQKSSYGTKKRNFDLRPRFLKNNPCCTTCTGVDNLQLPKVVVFGLGPFHVQGLSRDQNQLCIIGIFSDIAITKIIVKHWI